LPTFVYTAQSKIAKELVEGEIEAPSKDEAAGMLIRRGEYPIKIEEKKGGIDFNNLKLGAFFEKVTMPELIIFTSQMETLFKAGIPLIEIFDGLIAQAENPLMNKALIDIKAQVEDGALMNEAMKDYPKIFSETYVNMIAAGEVSGTLDESLGKLTLLMEREFETENRIKEVTRYPKIVISAVAVAVTILMSFVVPRFMVVFAKAKLELPLATKILIFLNYIFQHYWWVGMIILVGIYISFIKYTETKKGRLKWHFITLRMPIMGDIITKIKFAQFCSVLANLIKSGVPILQAIDVGAKAAGNDYLAVIFKEVEESVREGSGMAEPLTGRKEVPPIVIQMISAGEGSGALDDMLVKVANFFNEEADRKIKNLASLIEPILLFFLGGIVLFLALAIFLPMWDMTKMAH